MNNRDNLQYPEMNNYRAIFANYYREYKII